MDKIIKEQKLRGFAKSVIYDSKTRHLQSKKQTLWEILPQFRHNARRYTAVVLRKAPHNCRLCTASLHFHFIKSPTFDKMKTLHKLRALGDIWLRPAKVFYNL